jgi:hypothetical protein
VTVRLTDKSKEPVKFAEGVNFQASDTGLRVYDEPGQTIGTFAPGTWSWVGHDDKTEGGGDVRPSVPGIG